MSNDIVKYFAYQIKPTDQLLRGLGGTGVRSKSFVTLPVEFSDITIEIVFFYRG